MFGGKRAVRRFSLLLLEEGESYVKDFVAHCAWPAGVPGNWQRLAQLPGQLRLCTKSLFFEPDDVRIPIARLPFAQLQGLETGAGRSFTAAAHRVVRMRPNAADVPYAVDRDAVSIWTFELDYAGLEEFMPLAQQMLLASRLPPAEQEEMMEAFLQQQEAGLRFDAAHLRSPALETVALELPATCLTPLVREPGRLVVTDTRLYFQPQHNVTGDTPVVTHPLAAVAAVARRRSSLRHVGAEVFFMQPGPDSDVGGPFWGAPSAFFAFRNKQEREQFVGAIAAQAALGGALPGGRHVAAACGSILEAEGSWLARVTAAWQLGHISNFEYLMFLNLAAGRSFNDLTQYPVFPWVLADYTSTDLDLDDPASFRDLSRPVGALNPVRLAMFQRRYAEMAAHDPSDPPFLYGTHYSCPGYVMFWLVRAAPAHMLRLQNGRFDAPDRLFCSVAECWESVLANPTDLKELIPEFYMARPDYLLNKHKLALGSRQSGKVVGDVELPPWARASPDRFLAAQRAALEAPFVSANLHHWIDLIFGHQQQGAAAVEANNLFRHLSYEGAVDTDTITNRQERMGICLQINEFGQCPRQLFRSPHPPRLVCPPVPPLEVPAPGGGSGALAQAGDGGGQALSLSLVSTILAAASESEAPPPLEVPALLQQLDVVRQREEQEARELQLHGPVVSRATVIVEDFPAGQPAATAAAGAPGPSPDAASGGGDAGGLGGKAGAAYARLRGWANERKLGERLGAIKGALGEAVAAGPGEKGSAIRGLFKRGGPSTSDSNLRQQQHPEGGRGSGAGLAGEEPGEQAGLPPRAQSASQMERGAGRPMSPVGGGRVSSFTASLSQKFQSLASNLASPSGPAPPAAAAEGPAAAESGPAAPGEAVEEGRDVLAGLMRWKYSSRAPMPADSSDDEEAAEGGRDEGEQLLGQREPATSGGPGQPPAAAERPDSPGPAWAGSPEPQHPSQQAPLSPREKLLEAQQQRMLRGRAASPGGSRDDLAAAAAAAGAAPAAGSGSSAEAQGEGTSGAAPASLAQHCWEPGLRDRLRPGRVFAAGGEAVNAVALAAAGSARAVYCASHSGSLKLFDLRTGDQLRSSRVSEQPLTSLALLPPPPTSHVLSSPLTPGGVVPGAGAALPVALCGSYDSHVYAFSVELSRVVGSFQAHNDAVSCLAWLGSCAGQAEGCSGLGAAGSSSGSSLRLATGSWDASVRVWDLGDGRHPWGSGAAAAGSPALLATLGDLPGGVWALAASADGNLLLAGTEDGHVAAWDVRAGAKAWEQPASQDYIGGLQLTPDSNHALVAAADGNLLLLDMRRGGVPLSCAVCGPPLRCCATDGDLALAGAEDGSVHIWDVAQQRGVRAAGGGAWTPPGPDGLYEQLRSSPPSPVNALAIGWLGGGAPGEAPALHLVTGHEGGVVRSYQAGAA